MINSELANSRGIHIADQMLIQRKQDELSEICEKPFKRFKTHEQVVRAIEEREYELQRLWGFPEDSNFHSYWFRVEGCSCPKMDNMDLVGWESSVINMGCPFHGKGND